MDSFDTFHKLFSKKPIFAGVYSNVSKEKMLDEIRFLDAMQVAAVYLENINQTPEEITLIRNVLEHAVSLDFEIKIGVNIIPNEDGTGPISPIALAKEYGLPFIVQDMIVGTDYMKGNRVRIDKSYFDDRSLREDVFLIGGFHPPYAQCYGYDGIEHLLKTADERSDAVMVKVYHPNDKEVPIERITLYREKTTKPLILASRVTPNNSKMYAPLADGFIIGSGLRDEKKELCQQSIRNIQRALI